VRNAHASALCEKRMRFYVDSAIRACTKRLNLVFSNWDRQAPGGHKRNNAMDHECLPTLFNRNANKYITGEQWRYD